MKEDPTVNRKTTALLLAAALTLTVSGVSAFAADPDETLPPAQAESEVIGQESDQEVYASVGEEEDAQGGEEAQPGGEEADTPEDTAEKAEIVPDPVGSVSFANLSSRLRENNFNMLALQENISAIEALDYEKMTEDIRKSINQIADAQWAMTITGNSFSSIVLKSTYDSLRDTFDDLNDGVLQEDNDAVIRQLENAQDQIAMAAESLYIALSEMEISNQSLDRQLTALDRTIQEMELRYDLGQISALTLQQTKAGRTALVSGQQTLQMNIGNYKAQLEMLIGAEQTGNIRLQALPQVTGEQLADMDLEADLAAAKEVSYALFDAKRTLDDAKETFDDTAKKYIYNTQKYQYVSAQHTWEAAQYTYNATIQSFENSFRTLYNQVKDYQQVLAAAKTALAVEQDNYAAKQLKYDQGDLSKNKLLDAADEVTAAQEKVDNAAIDLFSAYNSYRWAVDYGILN